MKERALSVLSSPLVQSNTPKPHSPNHFPLGSQDSGMSDALHGHLERNSSVTYFREVSTKESFMSSVPNSWEKTNESLSLFSHRRSSTESNQNVTSSSTLEETLKQNEALRREVRSLQYDNVVLLTQLDTQIVCLSALTFDAERYKTRLEQEHVKVPASTFDEVRAASKMPTSIIPSGMPLPENLIQSAQLSEEELASFSSIYHLVNTVNDLQVRLRDAHLRQSSAADARLVELNESLKNIETQLEEVQQSRLNLKHRFEAELLSMARKRDAALNRLNLLERESVGLKKKLDEAKALESLEIEKLRMNELEQKIESLHDLAEKQAMEIQSLRRENNSMLTSSLVWKKENEYHSLAWKREQKINEGLRNERERFLEELNTVKSLSATLQTDMILMRGKLELAERMAEAQEAEVMHWKKRMNDTQQRHSEEIAFWEKNVQSGLSHLSELEMKLEASQERVHDLENSLSEKQKTFSETLCQKEEQISALSARLNQRQILLDEEVEARTCAQRHAADLAAALKNEKKDRQALVDQIVIMQKQAMLLKERHPTLNLEVLEKELQDYEHRQLCLVAEVTSLKQEKESLTSLLKKEKQRSEELQQLLEKAEASCEEKEGELREGLETIRKTQEDLDACRVALHDVQSQLQQKEEQLRELQKAFDEEMAQRTEHLNQLQQIEEQNQVLKELHSKETREFQERLDMALLDMKNAQQAHRLEVQAHSNDIRQYNELNEQLKDFQDRYDQLARQEKQNAAQLQSTIETLENALKDSRSDLQMNNAEKQLLKSDNDLLRQLLNEKVEAFENDDNASLKAQLIERLRAESVLKRNLDSVRLDHERLKQQVESLRNTTTQLRGKAYDDEQTIAKLEKELFLAKGEDGRASKGISAGDQELSLLQLRFNRLSEDYQYQHELRRNSEKQLNDLMADVEPSRRQLAALQGEVLNLKSALSQAEHDAKLYKEKYFEATRGRETDVLKVKEEFNQKMQETEEENSALKQEKNRLTVLYDGTIQQKGTLEAENDGLKKVIESHLATIHTLEKIKKDHELTCQKKQTMDSENHSEIQRRYQLQLSNTQRLLQETNREKMSLHHDFQELQQNYNHQCSVATTLQEELSQLQGTLRLQRQDKLNQETCTTDDVIMTTLIDEIVRMGILSAAFLRTATMQPSPTHSSLPILSHHDNPSGSTSRMPETQGCVTTTRISIDFPSSISDEKKTLRNHSSPVCKTEPQKQNDSLYPTNNIKLQPQEGLPQLSSPQYLTQHKDTNLPLDSELLGETICKTEKIVATGNQGIGVGDVVV